MHAPAAGGAAVVPATGAEDALLAIRNAVKLSGSLVATWGVALGVRILLPRVLGPDRFGAFNFADAFTATVFVALNFGIDTYVRTAVAVRPAHASDFVGGVTALRVALSALLTAGMIAALHAGGRPPDLIALVAVLGVAQLLLAVNATFAALLHAAGRVDGLSIATVVTKALWAAGVVAALWTGGNLLAIGAALCAAEAVKAIALWRLSQRHLALRLSVNAALTGAVLVASLPFFLNAGAHAIYARIDVTLLSLMASTREAGFYGAASTLGQVTALVTPLIAWVLVPLFARAAARSGEELSQALRRSLQLCFAIGVPTSLALALGADIWVRLLFGGAFAPAALALRLLAPMFVLTYATTSMACALIAEDRGWTVTGISLAAMVLNPVLNFALIPVARTMLQREGAGGVGCAAAMVTSEALVAAAMIAILRSRALDAKSLAALAKLVLACAPAIAIEALLPAPAPVRLAAALAAWLAFALGAGAIEVREIASFATAALRRTDA